MDWKFRSCVSSEIGTSCLFYTRPRNVADRCSNKINGCNDWSNRKLWVSRFSERVIETIRAEINLATEV